MLTKQGAPTVEIPKISAVSINAWDDLEQKLGRALSINEVAEHAELPFIPKLEMSGIRNRILLQFEDVARLLVPDPALIKNRVVREESKAPKQRTNHFNNPLLTKKWPHRP